MRAGFTITTEKGPIEVTITLAEYLKWAKREGKTLEEVDTHANLADWIEMLYWAAVRTGRTDDDFESFAASIIDLDRLPDEAPKGTPRAASRKPSSRSKS